MSKIKKLFSAAKDFVLEAAIVCYDKVKDFVVGFWKHCESVVILTLAATGLSALLGELPFWVMLPAWVESPMVIPVISVLIVWGIMKLAERRGKRHVVAAA